MHLQFYVWYLYLITSSYNPTHLLVVSTDKLSIFDLFSLPNPKITHGTTKEKGTRLFYYRRTVLFNSHPSLLASTDEHVPAFQQRVERQREREGDEPFSLSQKMAAKKALDLYIFFLEAEFIYVQSRGGFWA
jgi:hypothetical protein